MGMSLMQLLVILILVLVLFGAGKLPKVMGDLGRGLKSFREGMKGDHEHKDDDSKGEQ